MSRGGDAGRDEGIATVLSSHADEGWRMGYSRLANAFIDGMDIGAIFTGEQLRKHAEERGLGQPHHPNAWGGMASVFITGWLKYGRIVEEGVVTKAQDPKSHSHQYRIYRRTLSELEKDNG